MDRKKKTTFTRNPNLESRIDQIAKTLGMDPTEVENVLLAAALGVGAGSVAEKPPKGSALRQAAPGSNDLAPVALRPDPLISGQSLQTVRSFDVRQQFPAAPELSVRLAQRLIDEVTLLPGIRLQKRRSSIISRPPFFRIEYLLGYRAGPGVVVSLFGVPKDFDDPGRLLKPGAKSYSLLRLEGDDHLTEAIRLVKQAYRNRYGNRLG